MYILIDTQDQTFASDLIDLFNQNIISKDRILTFNTQAELRSFVNREESPDIILHISKKDIPLLVQDILYLEYANRMIQIHTTSTTLCLRGSLQYYEQLLPKDMFLRIHRGYIVNINHISTYTHTDITMNNHSIIPIGRKYRTEFLQVYRPNDKILS